MHVNLHKRQAEIFNDPHRFKVVAAGRRFGKSYLAAVILFLEASKDSKVRQSDGVEVDLALEEVYYLAPTFEQGKRIMWPLLKDLGAELIAAKYENTGVLTLINGRRLSIKGCDRPESLLGVGLSYVVLDEYAFMKEEVWERIITPMLTRTEGGALFIGTPDGKNHFYTLWLRGMSGSDPEWRSWHFPSRDNPFLPTAEIRAAANRMTRERFKQEYEASFEAGGGLILTRDMFPIVDTLPYPGDMYIAVDLAGFEKVEGGRKVERRDDHAIAVVLNHQNGWCIADIIHGRWDTRETALRLVKSAKDWKPVRFGIEKGIAKQAVLPYLMDEQMRLGQFFQVEELSHGNQHKSDRIAWAIQGRAEKRRIQLLAGAWNTKFLEQVEDFPSQVAHDDMLDAVAYIDQLAEPWYQGPTTYDEWEPVDIIAGY